MVPHRPFCQNFPITECLLNMYVLLKCHVFDLQLKRAIKLKYVWLKCCWNFMCYEFYGVCFTLITVEFSDHSNIKVLIHKNYYPS